MTTQEFLKTHQLLYKAVKTEEGAKHIAIIINKTNNETKRFNYEYSDIVASDFLIFTGLSLAEIAEEDLEQLIKNTYKITD